MTTNHIFFGKGSKQQEPPKPISGSIRFASEPMQAKSPDEARALMELARLEQQAAQGRFAWTKKHKYLGKDPQWHELWELLIPNYGCPCIKEYNTYKESNPPDFSSDEAYFMWGYNLHKWVCAKLEKPQLTVEQALEQWNRKFDEQGNSIRT